MSAQERLIRITLDHRAVDVDSSPEGDVIECRCGWFYTVPQYAAHVAAVIASSDDLAVVELPKPNEREDDDTATTWGEPYNDLQVGVHDEYADQVQVWVDYEPIEPWSPREAVEFASHLLAAAKAAEGVSRDGE